MYTVVHMNSQSFRQKKLKQALRNREQLFAAWVSYAHPSITETFAKAGFDFITIDMEHSTISLTEGQRIMLLVKQRVLLFANVQYLTQNELFKTFIRVWC